ncbi:MSCRAMM family protein [Saccharomonospora glauca]|uniref:SpaA-like prealbumin fold domain-containing protein n=1 Tax=Saccharomonospora glauca K62 TaxID=928724 RepID=I1D647_9PSEU|nr:hypothetical protein [Saccharomonospora glauca]EIF00422.1 hypothetical protein SacglDRAFT_03563 [Saccharomonospora glauca K62]
MTRRRLARAFRLALVAVLGTLSLVVVAPAASAEVEEGIGHRTTPGQSWGGRSRAYDWLGSYVVNGEHVFCVSFALKAPDSKERYEPGDELLTKWGDPLPADVAANISYLLLRYGDTRDADEAAALAHLLHSWTAAPRTAADLDPKKPFTEIGYDVDAHFAKLPKSAQEAVERLRADAEANRGPWNVTANAPEGEQIIDAPGEWSVTVTNADGKGVPGVEVTLTLTDLALSGDGGVEQRPTDEGAAAVGASTEATEPTTEADAEATAKDAKEKPETAKATEADAKTTTGTEDAEKTETAEGAREATEDGTESGAEDAEAPETQQVTVVTDENGTVNVSAVPTGEQPGIVATLKAPADRPYVRDPVTADTQRVVSTGGEQTLTAEVATTAIPAPGVVKVTKVDEETGEGIAGVPLRLTAEDKSSPAISSDGEELVGSDGEPLVVTTEGAEGVVTIENLRTPQKVCVIEVRPPNGYTDAFDPENPPTACGELRPGETLELRIANVANEVPRTIPAGAQTTTAQAATTTGAPVGALVALGGLALAVSALVGWLVRKRVLRQR